MSARFRLEALGEIHDRSAFRRGEDVLDRYFQTQVTQDVRRHLTTCFVAVDAARYPTIPAGRIGRLAVDQRLQGRGLGAALLADAAMRTLQAPPASFAVVVNAKNDQAAAFYAHHGSVAFAGQPRIIFVPIATAAIVLLAAGE